VALHNLRKPGVERGKKTTKLLGNKTTPVIGTIKGRKNPFIASEGATLHLKERKAQWKTVEGGFMGKKRLWDEGLTLKGGIMRVLN